MEGQIAEGGKACARIRIAGRIGVQVVIFLRREELTRFLRHGLQVIANGVGQVFGQLEQAVFVHLVGAASDCLDKNAQRTMSGEEALPVGFEAIVKGSGKGWIAWSTEARNSGRPRENGQAACGTSDSDRAVLAISQSSSAQHRDMIKSRPFAKRSARDDSFLKRFSTTMRRTAEGSLGCESISETPLAARPGCAGRARGERRLVQRRGCHRHG